MKTSSIVFAVALLAATPALADHDRSHIDQDWALISKCVREYGRENAALCVEIIDPTAVGRQAMRDYYRQRKSHDIEADRRECWSNPRIINPMRCSNGHPPVYSD